MFHYEDLYICASRTTKHRMSFLLPLSFQICPKTPESPNENELMTSYEFYTTPLANAITHNCVKHPLTRHSQL